MQQVLILATVKPIHVWKQKHFKVAQNSVLCMHQKKVKSLVKF